MKIFLVFTATILLLLGLHSCDINKNASLLPLKVGITDWPGYDVIQYAETSHLFRDKGLQVELKRFSSPPDAARALLRGSLDACFMNLSVAMQTEVETDSPMFIFVTDISSGADGIVAASGIDSVSDLTEKRVAAKFDAANYLILIEALQAAKVDRRKVEVLDVPNDVAENLFLRKQVDAVAIWEPMLSDLAKQVQGNIIHTTKNFETLVIDGLAISQRSLEAQSEALTRFTQVWFEVMEAVEVNPNRVFQAVAQSKNKPPEAFAEAYAGLKKGDREMNQQMFIQGRLGEAIEQLRYLFDSDPNFSGTLRQNVQINPGFVNTILTEKNT